MPKPVTFTKKKLAIVVRDVLNYPATSTRDYLSDPPLKIVDKILTAMTNALLRGETIKIRGFGTFKVKTMRPHKQYLHLFGKHRGRSLALMPARKVVKFIPYRVLCRL